MEIEVSWRGTDRSVVYALFAKSGFSDDLMAKAGGRDDVHLYTADDVLAQF